ncbi:MAG: hypothetical protein ED559_04070 [Phycisphaera sp.]|nr:MAG: hypothetical protein ED559_04070 [Phycisphaera sp.]
MGSKSGIQIVSSDSFLIGSALERVLPDLTQDELSAAGAAYKQWAISSKLVEEVDAHKVWKHFAEIHKSGKTGLIKCFQRLHGSARLYGMDVWITFVQAGAALRHQLASTLVDQLESLTCATGDGSFDEEPEWILRSAIAVFCDEVRDALKRLADSEPEAELKPEYLHYADISKAASEINWDHSMAPVAYAWKPAAERLERIYTDSLERRNRREGLLGINSFPARFLSIGMPFDGQITVRPASDVNSLSTLPPGQADGDGFPSMPFVDSEKIKRSILVRIRWEDDQEVVLCLNFRDNPLDGQLLDLLESSLAPAVDLLVGWLRRHGIRMTDNAEPLFGNSVRTVLDQIRLALATTDRHQQSELLRSGIDSAIPDLVSPSVAVHRVLPVTTEAKIRTATNERAEKSKFGGHPPALRPGLIWVDPETKRVCWSNDGSSIVVDSDIVPDEYAQPGEDGMDFIVEFAKGIHELPPPHKGSTTKPVVPLKSLCPDPKKDGDLVETGLSVQAARWTAPIFFRSLKAAREDKVELAKLSEKCRYSDRDKTATDWELAVPIRQLPPIGLGGTASLSPLGVIDVECPAMPDRDPDQDNKAILRVDAIAKAYSSFDAIRRYLYKDQDGAEILNECLHLMQSNSHATTRAAVLEAFGNHLTYRTRTDKLEKGQAKLFPDYIAFVNPLRAGQESIECAGGECIATGREALQNSPMARELAGQLWHATSPIADVASVLVEDLVVSDSNDVSDEQRAKQLEESTGIPASHGIQNVYCAIVASHLEPLPCAVALLGWKSRQSPDLKLFQRIYLPVFTAVASVAAMRELKY